MKILYYLDPFFEMNEPFVMQGWLSIYAKIHESLKLTDPNYEARLVAYDSVEMKGALSFKDVGIFFSQGELRCDWKIPGDIRDSLERTSLDIESFEKKLLERLDGFNPDVIFLLAESKWLKNLFNKTVFLHFEVNWFNFPPFPTSFQIDIAGYGKGRVLSEYSEEILAGLCLGEAERKEIESFKENFYNKLDVPVVISDFIKKIRNEFSKVILLPLAGEKQLDGHTSVFASLDYFFDNHYKLGDCYLISEHPGGKGSLNAGELRYLTKKYPFIFELKHKDFSFTNSVIPLVDAVVGDFSSVSYFSLFSDADLIYIDDKFLYRDEASKIISPLSRLISESSKDVKDKILYWLVTKYAISTDNFFDGDWMHRFVVHAVENRATNEPWKLYSNYGLEFNRFCRNEQKAEIAVILHLFYPDLWEEFEQALSGIPKVFDLYVSVPVGDESDISNEILKSFPDAKIYELPNKGRDILPFLTIFKEIQPFNYKLILKLHTKKSLHLKGYRGVDDFGGKWRQSALSSLAQWNKRVNDIFDLFDSNPDLGVFSPFGHLYPFKSTDANYQTITQLIPGVDEDAFNEKQFVFADGSMFWFRPEAIKAVLKLDLTAENFEEESGQVDATLAHAIERLFGVLCQAAGYILADRIPIRDDIAYQDWLEEKRKNDLSRDLLYLSDDSIKPVIHCLVYVDNEDLSMLANTIDSMGGQSYELWHLSVISSFSCPDEMFNEVPQLSWLKIEQQVDLHSLLSEIGVQSDWISFLEAGDCLESHALSSCVEYLNKNPEWNVVYTDEDRVSPEGFFHSPKFKPDFNLDLLYSIDYMGGLTLFKIDSLNELERIGYPNPFAGYDLVLHYLEYFGESSVGHIENILLHRNDWVEQFFISQFEFRKAALVNHFKRIECHSIVSKSLVDAVFDIKYPNTDDLKVSIIIPTKDQLAFLKPCIDSVIENTSYPCYEIIIIDNQSIEAETKQYFEEIQQTYPNKIHVIEYQKPYNYSAINNFAVEQANGDYLVLLNNDTMVLQEEWLQGMLSHAQREEVGIVGVKLVYPNKTVQHAGVMLGMGSNGVAEHPHIGIPMGDAGYMNRAMVTQNVSAVTAACLMIEKKLYQQVGGLDEEKFKILYNDVDLCLKVRELGYKIVWMPYVTLIHHGSGSLKKVKQDKKKAEQSQQEVDNMLEKWLPQLANDPVYNRNLSLKTTDFQVDTSMNVSWNVDFKDKSRIYAFPTDSQGVGQYRVRGPLKALTQAGMVETSLANNLDQLVFPTPVEIERIKPDILLIQNGFLDHMLTAWKRYRKFNDVFMVCGQDDVVYMLPDNHPKKGSWPSNIRRKVKEQFQHSDRVIVANKALAEEFKKMANEIVVVPNYLENARWGSLVLPENIKDKKLRVGWAGGQEHIGDLQFILPVVKALHKEVDWVFMGLCLEELQPYVKETHAGVEFDLYPQELADLNLDLAIAPLMHNKFNECKTNLRLLEYGVLGWPVVCSDVLPYQNAPVTRVANNTQHWIKILRDKINEPDALSKEGRILQQWVIDNYMLDDHVDEWYAALMP